MSTHESLHLPPYFCPTAWVNHSGSGLPLCQGHKGWMELSNSIHYSCPPIAKSCIEIVALKENWQNLRKMQETQGLGEASNLLPMGSQASNTFLYFFWGGGVLFRFVLLCYRLQHDFGNSVSNCPTYASRPRLWGIRPRISWGKWNRLTKEILNVHGFSVPRSPDKASVRPTWWSPGAQWSLP